MRAHDARELFAAHRPLSRLQANVAAVLISASGEILVTLASLTPGEVGQPRKRINELSRQQEKLESQLAKNSNEFRGQMVPATLATVRGALPADAVLVEWLRYRPFDPKAKFGLEAFGLPRYVAYVLRQSGRPIAIDLGAAEDIENLVHEFRLAAVGPRRDEVQRRAAALSKRIIEPLRLHIAGARHLLLSPDGTLNLVPMAAMVDEHGRYLIERFEITYLTSGRDLLRIAASEAIPSSNGVLMADSDYGERLQRLANVEPRVPLAQERSEEFDRGGLVFRSLPGTALEAEAISNLLALDAARVFTGDQASEGNLKRVHGPRILHLATHGFFLGDPGARQALLPTSARAPEFAIENPLLRSGLALAGANQRRSGLSDDGILTALEASRLDLRGTALVVLSACETGVGEVRNGAGINGLRRGLLLAGAQTQISSLLESRRSAHQGIDGQVLPTSIARGRPLCRATSRPKGNAGQTNAIASVLLGRVRSNWRLEATVRLIGNGEFCGIDG